MYLVKLHTSIPSHPCVATTYPLTKPRGHLDKKAKDSYQSSIHPFVQLSSHPVNQKLFLISLSFPSFPPILLHPKRKSSESQNIQRPVQTVPSIHSFHIHTVHTNPSTS